MRSVDHAAVNTPGAFAQAGVDPDADPIHINFEGAMLRLLLEIDEAQCRPFIMMENGREVPCVKLD